MATEDSEEAVLICAEIATEVTSGRQKAQDWESLFEGVTFKLTHV